MANSFVAQPTPPNQADGLAGDVLKALPVSASAELLNYTIATAGCDDQVSQEWPLETLQADNVPRPIACAYRIPQVSPVHTIYDVEIRAKCTTSDGVVRADCVETGLSASMAINNAAYTVFTAATNVGVLPNAYATFNIYVFGGTGVTTVESIRITPRVLATPLAEGFLDGELEAFGLLSTAADEPFPSKRARALIAAITNLRNRPRMRTCKSAVIDKFNAAAWTSFPSGMHASVGDWSASPAGRDAEWTAWAYVKPDAAVDKTIRLLIFSGGVGIKFVTTVPFDALQPNQWVKLTGTIKPPAPVRHVGRFGGMVGVDVGDGDEDLSATDESILLSLSVWGPA